MRNKPIPNEGESNQALENLLPAMLEDLDLK
jgi:hypothetical protein